jgi:glucose-1-phosphate cytidylyltransferase
VKVVLFCGGLGLRLREHFQSVPKPMVPIGERPIVWHIMKYYAHHGHADMILCLGYKADVVKDYFLSYNEALSNDFVLHDGGRSIELLSSDIRDWRVTFVDTGLQAKIGQRLRAVRNYLAEEDVFLASYGDCLTDAPLNSYIDDFRRRDKIAAFLSVRPTYTFHVVAQDDHGLVKSIEDVMTSEIWINGGYFIFRNEIFDYIDESEELVEEPFRRLIKNEKLLSYRYEGFWAPMDTLKDRQKLDTMWETGRPPWAVWQPTKDALMGGALERAGECFPSR